MRLIRDLAIPALHDLSTVPPNLLPNIPIRLATLILHQLNPVLPRHNPNRKLVQRPGVLFPLVSHCQPFELCRAETRILLG